jgi:hypothetical protein
MPVTRLLRIVGFPKSGIGVRYAYSTVPIQFGQREVFGERRRGGDLFAIQRVGDKLELSGNLESRVSISIRSLNQIMDFRRRTRPERESLAAQQGYAGQVQAC